MDCSHDNYQPLDVCVIELLFLFVFKIQRWRNRVNQLTEQIKNQGDPDEIKKLQEEKKQMTSQHKSALDEVEKSKARMEALRNEITRLQAEINVMKVC